MAHNLELVYSPKSSRNTVLSSWLSSIVKKFGSIGIFRFSRISGQTKVQPDLGTKMAG